MTDTELDTTELSPMGDTVMSPNGDIEVSTLVDTGRPETSASVDTDTPETFPREYVEKLRDENAKHRQRAADRDTLAERLHTALVAATGRLADPSDLPYSDEHLDDPDTLTAALDALLAAKPHLASRKPIGNIGQGAAPEPGTVNLSAILRERAS